LPRQRQSAGATSELRHAVGLEQEDVPGGGDPHEGEEPRPSQAERQARGNPRRPGGADQARRTLEYRRDDGGLPQLSTSRVYAVDRRLSATRQRLFPPPRAGDTR